MSFSSLFFICFFLPVFCLFYFRQKDIERKNQVLLIFSLIFYTFGGLRYLLLLFAMTAAGWYGALRIRDAADARQRRFRLILSVAVLLGALGFFKYTGFFLGTLDFLFRQDWPVLQIALPLGISFYTFKLISYLADVYRNDTEAQQSYWLLLLYTGLFHHCTAGPIVRYGEIRQELTGRRISADLLIAGIFRFCTGLAKKTILADHCGALAETLLPVSGNLSAVPASGVWLGSLFYMLQIYLDFSAYSDMAIGLGWMIGFHYKENFNYPYLAASVRDFWRRWHISLSTFFRDYVYIPLGGSRTDGRRLVRNLLVVWALTGLWHGASWNYILWGLYYFLFIVLENRRRRKQARPLPAIPAHLVTLVIVFVGWIFFRFEDLASLGTVLRGLLGLNGNGAFSPAAALVLKNNLFFLAAALIAVTPAAAVLCRSLAARLEKDGITPALLSVARIATALLLLFLSILALAGSSYTPFLYHQF
jgi:alginate O-acetyltransferase complex protein AlgI